MICITPTAPAELTTCGRKPDSIFATASATLGVREHKVQIPYGVVNLDDCKVQEFTEKPSESYFVNTGVYILNPEMLDLLPENEPFPMPDLLEKAKDADKPVMAFPVTEYWLDIGRIEDFNRAEDVVKKIVS